MGAQQRPRPNNDQSDISGLWLNNTATPLVRPAELPDKAFFTEDEAREYETHYLADRVRGLGGDFAFELQVNGDIQEPGHVLPNRRTSLIVDPPNGRVPPSPQTGRHEPALAPNIKRIILQMVPRIGLCQNAVY
jgi:hypothetical protein